MDGFQVVEKRSLAPTITLMQLQAPRVARKARAGQFVVLRVHQQGERIPFTIARRNPDQGTITIVFQEVGKTTRLLAAKAVGQTIPDLVGPLGVPSETGYFGRVACIGGGAGIAYLYPEVVALRESGNRITTIAGARTSELLFFLDELKELSDELHVITDDGSSGRRGLVTNVLTEVLEAGERFDRAVAIGPVPMMKATCEITRAAAIPTMVSLNPIMVDGTGMCGSCRVTVGGRTRFACVEGPNFDGHQVDFRELSQRQRMFIPQEQESLQQAGHICRLETVAAGDRR